MRRPLRTALAIGATTAVAVLGLAGVALAHVTVNPNNATQGAYARIAFRVPTESDTASTTKLEVALPADQPIASVATMPVPGWTATTETSKLATPIKTDDGDTVTEAVTKITWTADSTDTAIKPGQFQEFPVSLGPLPKSDKLVFKTLQTYSDGNIVRWIDDTVAVKADTKSSDSTGTAALTIAIIGGLLGLAGLLLGGLAFTRTRRTT
jgi:periplasmic copper chaperone A